MKYIQNITKWLFIFIGSIEAVWGLCQMYGLAQSSHSLYALTGSFYNPGPYSGFLAMTFPVCLDEWLKSKEDKKGVKYYFTLIAMLLIISVLPAGMSRSAWIAGILASVYVIIQSKGKYAKHLFHSKKWLLLIPILTTLSLVGIYFLKTDSANGRLLMWKIASRSVCEQPCTGYGCEHVS